MTNRDYTNFDLYYEELLQDIYPQPPDEGHMKAIEDIIFRWIAPLGVGMVLDVGCGDGQAGEVFRRAGVGFYTGVTLEARPEEEIIQRDFNFLPAVSYDLVFARHSLEHSPFPLITLMEWHRVSSRWLALVLPNPEHYTYVGRNHYSVMSPRQAAWILRRAGWKMRKYHRDQQEIWFLCEKFPRISYEGWASIPLGRTVYEFERDMLDAYGDLDVTKYIR